MEGLNHPKAVQAKLLKDSTASTGSRSRASPAHAAEPVALFAGLRCWRRYNARNVVRDFLRQTAKMQGGRAILQFQYKVRYAQRLVRDWVRVRKRRMAFLRTVRGNRDRSTPSSCVDGVLAEIRRPRRRQTPSTPSTVAQRWRAAGDMRHAAITPSPRRGD